MCLARLAGTCNRDTGASNGQRAGLSAGKLQCRLTAPRGRPENSANALQGSFFVLAKFHAAAISLAVAAISSMNCSSTSRISDGGSPDAGGPDGGGSNIGVDAGVSVLQHHNHPSRDGTYVD